MVHDTQHYNLAVNYSGVGQFYCNVKDCNYTHIFFQTYFSLQSSKSWNQFLLMLQIQVQSWKRNQKFCPKPTVVDNQSQQVVPECNLSLKCCSIGIHTSKGINWHHLYFQGRTFLSSQIFGLEKKKS